MPSIEDNTIKRSYVKINDVWVPLLGADVNSVLNIDSGSNILSGTEEPTSSIGVNGNLYFKIGTITPLESISTNGSQWFQMNYSLNDNSKFEIDINVASQNSYYATILGRPDDAYDAWLVSHIYGNPNLTAAWGGVDVRSNQYDITNRRVHIQYSKSHVYVTEEDGTIFCDWQPNAGSNYDNTNLFLFAQGANNNCITATLYQFIIKENETVVRNFIPVLDSNNVACFYETITQQFFYNQGTGSFIAGNTSGHANMNIILSAYVKVNNAWQPLVGTDISNINLNNKALLNYLNNIILNETNVSITTESSMTASLDSTNHILQVTWNSGSSIGIRYKPYFLIPSFVNSMHYKIETGSRSYDTSIRFAPGVGILPASALPDLKNGVEYNADRNNSSFLQIAYTQQRESILEGSFDLSNITEDTVLCIFCAGWDVTFSEIIFS